MDRKKVVRGHEVPEGGGGLTGRERGARGEVAGSKMGRRKEGNPRRNHAKEKRAT